MVNNDAVACEHSALPQDRAIGFHSEETLTGRDEQVVSGWVEVDVIRFKGHADGGTSRDAYRVHVATITDHEVTPPDDGVFEGKAVGAVSIDVDSQDDTVIVSHGHIAVGGPESGWDAADADRVEMQRNGVDDLR